MAYKTLLGKLDWIYVIILLLFLFLLVYSHITWKTQGTVRTRKTVSVVSRRTIQVAKDWQLPNVTHAGIYKSNDMDTCEDTCSAGVNWKLVTLSNYVCDFSPFLESYKPVKDIPVVRASTVCMDPNTSREYFIVGDQFLWFGTMTNNSYITTNQLISFNIPVYYNPFDAIGFGTEADEDFIPFTSKGGVISFES